MGVFKLLTAEQFKAVLASPHLNTRYEEQVFAFAFAFATAFVLAFAFEIEFVIDRLSLPKYKIRGREKKKTKYEEQGFFFKFGKALADVYDAVTQVYDAVIDYVLVDTEVRKKYLASLYEEIQWPLIRTPK